MEIHNKIAGIIIKNKKLLMVRKYNEPHFILPGGRNEPGETEGETLSREIMEELNLAIKSSKPFKTYEAIHFKDRDKLIKMKTFIVEVKGIPKPGNEINEYKYIDSLFNKNNIQLASINKDLLVPELKKLNLIK